MPTNKHPPDTSPVSDTTQRTCTCTRTLFLVYEFRHEAADPSCLSAENQNLRHGSWFSRGGHGWYGHNAHNVPNEARGIRNGTMACNGQHACRSLIISSSYQRKARGHAVPFSNAKRLVCHASVDPCPSTAPLTAHQSHITNAKRYRSI